MSQGDRTCRSCGTADKAVGVVCATCGPTVGVHSGSDDACSLVCERCREVLPTASGLSPAASCTACGGQGFGWRDAQGAWSDIAIDELPQQTGRWVRVEFDGAFSGTDRTATTAIHVSGRRFAVRLLEGVFADAAYVDGPPTSINSGVEPPIREPSLSGVMVFGTPSADEAAADEHPGGPFQVTLKDFRLHDWRHVSEDAVIGRAEGTHGRLEGTGYGRLGLDLARPERPGPAPGVRAVAPAVRRVQERVNRTAERAVARARAVLPPQLRPDAAAVQDCPVCSRRWFLVIAAFVWVFCTWRAALVAAVTLWLACVIQEWLCRRGFGFHGTRRPWRTVIEVVLGLTFVAFALLALREAVAAAPLAACGSWFFPGYWDFLVLLILCGVLPARWPRWVVTALFLWALLASCTAAGRTCSAPQAMAAAGGTAAVASGAGDTATATAGASAANGASATAGATATDTGTAGSTAATGAGTPTPATAPTTTTGPMAVPEALWQSLSEIFGGVASGVTALARPDATAEMLQGLPAGAGAGITLASVSQARQDPDRYLQCFEASSGRSGPMHSIYLGYDAFFDRDSDRIKPAAAESSLRELLEVFAALPGSRFVVTGHADSTGTDAHNLALSRRRAQAVADWLVQRGVAPARIEVVGAGSAVPLIRPDATLDAGGYLSTTMQAALPQQLINRINRRVEVAVDCPPPRRGA